LKRELKSSVPIGFFCRRLLFGPKPPRFVVGDIVSPFLSEEQLAVLTAKGVERRRSHWARDLSDKLHWYVALRTVGHLHCHFFTPATASRPRPEFPQNRASGSSRKRGWPEQPSQQIANCAISSVTIRRRLQSPLARKRRLRHLVRATYCPKKMKRPHGTK
jgi:hypothetical protein